jgi:hypothetical protein
MTRTFKSVAVFLTLFLYGGVRAAAQPAPANPQDDIQFWNEAQVVTPLHERVDLLMIGVLRFGRNVTHPVDERAGAGLAFKPHRSLTVTPTYLYTAQQPAEGRKNFEHRLILNVTGRFSLGKFNFTDRNLIEFRVRHALNDIRVYRNRLQVDYPVKLGDFGFRVFVADEIFHGLRPGAWDRNRVAAGLLKQFSPRTYAEFFYLRQNDGRSRPGDVHAFGTLFRFTLSPR